ncbi:DHHA1 domain-containing protein [Methanolobus halotolerans]|uniref:Recombinase RecJ n=1 Tax=Methanolobus halotolerans TaxID=2052935 RepID=A0A4E0PZB5_9EURY|nr:DHH family phosphoesterase [Methanolobus halotolerans]TGC10983.1 recombinase RecJ [Methanolobus halotolerans]
MSETMIQMARRAAKCAEEIKKHKEVQLVSHIDADGISSGAIIAKALEGADIDHEMLFVKQLDENIIRDLADSNPELTIFTDLGSGQIEHINNYELHAVISDHHRPQGDTDLHLNPHLFGANGSFEISGSGTTFILASQLDKNNSLADLAIVGCVGDMQNRKYGKLVSLNREILEDNPAIVIPKNDISLYGKQTRPIFKMLQFSSDPYLPGLTGSEDACIGFLHNIGLRSANDEKWRRWIDLTEAEKVKITSALFQYSVQNGLSSYNINRLVNECYLLLPEKEGTEMRDASEYATLLNATGRYMQAEIGMAVCMGDREDAYEAARRLLYEHRKNLVEGLNFVRDTGVTQLSHLQFFDAGSNIPETIVGIVAGMSHASNNRRLPIVAFADKEDGHKISARGTQELVNKGLNLSEAISQVCQEIGGAGGGHDIAAGATVPFGKKQEFIDRLNSIIASQIASKA